MTSPPGGGRPGPAGGGGFRLLLFVDSRAPASLALAKAVLAAGVGPAGGTVPIEVVGIVDGARRPAKPFARDVAARVVRRVLDPSGPPSFGPLRPPAPLIVPPGRDLNDPAFVADVRRLAPDASLNLLAAQLFRADLLDAVRAPCNYHDALLPRYRGVGATAWSVYDGAARSGFSFHRMTPGLDDGPILLQDAVGVPVGATTAEVDRAKTRLACERIGDALAKIAAGDRGREQVGEPSVVTQADRRAMRTVDDPASLTFDELERRLRAFEILTVRLGSERWEVTALRRAWRPGRVAFRTADGVLAEPHRCVHLPVALYRAYRPLRGR